jgi:hypothetical protein
VALYQHLLGQVRVRQHIDRAWADPIADHIAVAGKVGGYGREEITGKFRQTAEQQVTTRARSVRDVVEVPVGVIDVS